MRQLSVAWYFSWAAALLWNFSPHNWGNETLRSIRSCTDAISWLRFYLLCLFFSCMRCFSFSALLSSSNNILRFINIGTALSSHFVLFYFPFLLFLGVFLTSVCSFLSKNSEALRDIPATFVGPAVLNCIHTELSETWCRPTLGQWKWLSGMWRAI